MSENTVLTGRVPCDRILGDRFLTPTRCIFYLILICTPHLPTAIEYLIKKSVATGPMPCDGVLLGRRLGGRVAPSFRPVGCCSPLPRPGSWTVGGRRGRRGGGVRAAGQAGGRGTRSGAEEPPWGRCGQEPQGSLQGMTRTCTSKYMLFRYSLWGWVLELEFNFRRFLRCITCVYGL